MVGYQSEVEVRRDETGPLVGGAFAAWHKHGDVVAIEQDLVEFGDTATFARILELGHVLQDHVHKVVESQERAHDLLVIAHDDVDTGAYALIDQFKRKQLGRIDQRGVLHGNGHFTTRFFI